MSPMSSPGARSTGRRLGRYHLAEPLGGGPTGEVFRAKVYGVAGFERQFAVKRFHPEFVGDPDTAAAVATAARTYGSLEHPRVARLHEYGVTGGETFTATELIHGVDLAQLMSVGRSTGQALPPGACAALISQAARAVGYAHGRGISHLGLCPTNLIATAEGEIKITDFCLLPARLPSRPGSDPSLLARLSYLAPEQIAGEPTSAATDVFQLGVIAYELFAGQQAFSGSNSAEVAHKIQSTHPPPLPLPLAVSQVLLRSLARSPFERFPDARALADALDAAVRSAPIPGAAHEISVAARDAVQRMNEMREAQVSGAVSFPLPAPPAAQLRTPPRTPTTMRMQPLAPTDEDAPTGKKVPVPKLAAPAPASMSVPAPVLPPHVGQTIPAPGGGPPIKMPLLVESSGEELDEEVPTTIKERSKGFVSVPGENRPRPPGPPPTRPGRPAMGTGSQPAMSPGAPPPLPGRPAVGAKQPGPRQLPAAAPAYRPPGMPAAPPSRLGGPDGQLDAMAAGMPMGMGGPAMPPMAPPGQLPRVPPFTGDPAISHGNAASAPPAPLRLETLATEGPADVVDAEPPVLPELLEAEKQASRGRQLVRPLALSVLILVVLTGGYAVYAKLIAGDDAAARSPSSVAAASVSGADAGTRVAAQAADAGAPAVPSDAQVAENRAPDAAVNGAAVITPDDKLVIRSEPRGARVYIDGSPQGKTPITLDPTADRHRLALVLAGYRLYTADIDGSGKIEVTLEEVSPPDGPAGIKVRCNKKNRYYVLLNGEETGQLCPSERIGTKIGSQIIEIYDPITDSRREFRIEVENTRRSIRLRVD